MKLKLIAASHRPDSINLQLLKIAGAIMAEVSGATLEYIEYDKLDLPLYNDLVRTTEGFPAKLENIVEVLSEADCFIWAVPEYNWSYPASIKNLIDWLSCLPNSPLKGKPIFLMCATPSERGGMMGLNHLKTVLEYMGMWVYPLMFGLGKAEQMINNDILVPKKQLLLQEQLHGFNSYCARHI